MKKLISYLLILSIIICQNAVVFGAEMTMEDVVYNGSIIEVKGTLPTKNADIVTLVACKKGGSITNPADVISVIEGNASENGEFVLRFEMQDELGTAIDGEYTIYVASPNATKKEINFKYLGSETRNNALNSLGKITSKKEFEDFINNPLYESVFIVAGVRFKDYTAMNATEKAEIINLFYQDCNFKTLTETEFATRMNTAIGITKLNNSAENYGQILADINPVYSGNIDYNTIIKNCDPQQIQSINSQIVTQKPYKNINTFTFRFKEVYGLFTVNSARLTNIENALLQSSAVLGYDSDSSFIKYKNLTDKTNVNSNIVVALKSNPATNISELLSIIATCTGNSKPSTGGGGGGGSGGGGGGTSGGNHYESTNMDKINKGDEKPDKNTNTDGIFTDLNSSLWAKEAIMSLYKKGVIKGYDGNLFKPDNNITREEFVKIVVEALGVDIVEVKPSFSDVDSDRWSAKYIGTAQSIGLIVGDDSGLFMPDENILRQDMAVIIKRGLDIVKIQLAENNSATILDLQDCDEYAKSAVLSLVQGGIVKGDDHNNFSPKAYLTRAETAMVVYTATFVNETTPKSGEAISKIDSELNKSEVWHNA